MFLYFDEKDQIYKLDIRSCHDAISHNKQS